jgi:predicted CXXCH cytochrome family protein
LDANATGDGFLHLMKSSSWTFPTALKPGNYDSLKLVDPTLAAHANVQCESCHGPGSAHGSVVTDNKIATTINHQQCITCHDAPDHHIKPNEWRASAHFNSVGEPDDPEHMNRGSKTSKDSDCARCHTSAGFIDVFVKSSNPPESSFSNAPYKEPGAVGCATCHDPHNAQNEHQLRKPVTELCASCHSVRVSGYSGLHNSHQGPMLQGRDGKEFPGYTYSNSTHTAVAEQCATCHMAAPEDPNLEYLYGGHTFHVTYNNGTPDDETDDVLNSTGCVSCHQGGITLEDVKETQDEIKAKLDELKGYLKLRTDGRPLFPTDNTLTTMEADIHFNWYFVNNDNSYGVHNKQYALDLLNSSIEEAKKLVSVEPIDNSIPRSASLAQNYPNPFNPSTTIEFSIPKGTNVRITVFDASGRTVNVLVNDYYTPGTYRTTWNGTSLIDGQRIANSGVYYYRIEAGNYTATKKMILMK